MTKMVPEVVRCAVVGSTSVRLAFRDGWSGVLDLAPALHGRVFALLKRPENFCQVQVLDGALVWPSGADICPSVLRYWCKLGRVCSQQELDDHFASELSAQTAGSVAESKTQYRTRRKS